MIANLAAKASLIHGEKHPELICVAGVSDEIRTGLEPHLRKEEVLFPMIRALASVTSRLSFHCGSITNPIGVMEQEHTNGAHGGAGDRY